MIEELLQSNEGKTLEFKENLTSLQGIVKTIVAFANTAGGIIVIGVEDKTKKVVGVANSLTEEERLTNVISASIVPLLIPDIEIQSYRTKELIVINVPHAAGPYYIKSSGMEKGTYVRLGSTNRSVDEETLQSLKNFAKNVYFDETPYLQGSASDLDWPFIEDLFKKANKKITKEHAHSMGLLVQKGTKELPTYGGIILFGVNRLKFFPEAIIRCVRFLGDERGDILDQIDIEIYLPFALEEAIKFIQRNTRLGAKITYLARQDIPQYPLIAIREAVMNAIVHADYTIKGVYISIAIFDERIEITNPGGLPFGFTMERALAGSSRVRNRVIAKVFYHLKWIEQWGRGLGRIVKECAQRGLAAPKFEEVNNQFRVTLYSTQEHAIIFTPWQKEFITYLKKKEIISTQEAAALWEVTSRTARLRLIKLVDAGIIKKIGTSLRDPYGGYIFAHDFVK